MQRLRPNRIQPKRISDHLGSNPLTTIFDEISTNVGRMTLPFAQTTKRGCTLHTPVYKPGKNHEYHHVKHKKPPNHHLSKQKKRQSYFNCADMTETRFIRLLIRKQRGHLSQTCRNKNVETRNPRPIVETRFSGRKNLTTSRMLNTSQSSHD